MSTFEDLISRVETTNVELAKVRDTIERESIDSTSALIDTIRESLPKLPTKSNNREYDDFIDANINRVDPLEIQKVELLDQINESLMDIYAFMLGEKRDRDRKIFVPTPTLDVFQATKEDGEEKKGGVVGLIGNFFKGLLGKLLTIGLVALVANELLNFFNLTFKDVFDKVAEGIDFALSSEGMDYIGQKIDAALRSAIDLFFRDPDQEATIGRYVEKAGIWAIIGRFLIGGPWGLLIGGIFGLLTEYFDSDQGKQLLTTVQEAAGKFFDAFVDIFDQITSMFTGNDTDSFRLKLLDERFEKVKEAESKGKDKAQIGLFESIDRDDIQKEYNLVSKGAVEDVIAEQEDVDKHKVALDMARSALGDTVVQLMAKGVEEKDFGNYDGYRRQLDSVNDLTKEIEQEQKEVLQAREIVRQITEYGETNNLNTNVAQNSYTINPQTDRWELNYE